MDSDKTIGYALLMIGLGIIFFALFSSFSIFSGKTPPQIFNIQQSTKPVVMNGQELPSMELIPSDYLNQSGNLTFFMLFMFFLVSAGGKISSIGVSMLHAKKPDAPKQA
jgi:hypothetical protein